MQTKKYIRQFYRALAIGCMVYAVSLIAETAAATETAVATGTTHLTVFQPR